MICFKPSNAYSRSELRVNRFPEVDPSILRETSPEVHDEYLKKFDRLPAFAPANKPSAVAGQQPARPSSIQNGVFVAVPQDIAAPRTPQQMEEINRNMKKFTDMIMMPFSDDEDPEFPLAEHVAGPDEPEDDIERDNNKINQIVAAVKNSSAIKLDIPQIDLGQEGITFIESDVDEYTLTLFSGAASFMSSQDKHVETRFFCVGSSC